MTLQEETSSADACQIIGELCLRQYRRNEELLLVARDPEALHQARVALRRMRSAIAIFEPILDSAAVNHFQGELNDLVAAPLVLRKASLEGEQGAGDLLTHRRKARIVEALEEAMAKLMDRKVFWS